MRAVVKQGLSGVAALASALSLAAAGAVEAAATAAPTATTKVAADWTAVRLTCRTLPAGTVCASLQRYGATNSYRGMYYVVPAAGQWIKPLADAVWKVNYIAPDRNGDQRYWIGNPGYQPVCAGDCGQLTAPKVIHRPHTGPAVHTLLFDTPQGRYDVHAGVTAMANAASINNCLPDLHARVNARFLLTTTQNNRVWYQRSVGFSDTTRPRTFTGTDVTTTDHTFFRKSYTGTVAPTYAFRSPTYTTRWQRVRIADGSWETQRTVASLTYVNPMDEQYTDTSDTLVEFVC